MFPIIIVVVVIIIMAVVVIQSRVAQARLEKSLESEFGEEPAELSRFDLESIRSYYEAKRGNYEVDEITWHDLDMDRVFARLNHCHTSAGEEYLYDHLHQTVASNKSQQAWEALSTHLMEHKETRLKLQRLLCKTGKTYYNNVGNLIFHAEYKKFRHAWIYRVLQVMPLALLLFMIVNIPLGLVLAIASAVTNGIIHFSMDRKIQNELKAISYLSAVLWGCDKLLKTADEKVLDFLPEMSGAFQKFKSTMKTMSGVMQSVSTDLDAIVIYIRYIFLQDIIRYHKVVSRILEFREEIQTLYESVGKLDALISILSYRAGLDTWCRPEFGGEKVLAANDICHPLLRDAVPNTIETTQGCLVTGSNASGKSTFIKAAAINGILAQTVYTCTAKKFRMAHGAVITSMAVQDNIVAGESYFIAEIRSLKRIIDNSRPDRVSYCFIDEILRGTNTVERIAASATLLHRLGAQNTLCMVATHDIELAELLEKEYGNYHFSEKIDNGEILFDYKLKKGPSTTKNAIKLLGLMGFDAATVQAAETLAQYYMDHRRWE